MTWQLRKIAFKVINSSTLILPAWQEMLEELKMKDRIIPHDVATCWNLTYDMLRFALEYRKAIDILTADRNNNLQSYELSKQEWTIVAQLCDILKVCDVSNPWIADSSFLNGHMFRSWKMRHCSSCIPHPVWLWLSPLWILSMTNLLHTPMIRPYRQPSKPLSNSERKHWTGTTRSQTRRRSTKSLWVDRKSVV